MRRLDPAPIRQMALRCERNGAEYLDINPGHLSKRNEDRMAFLVEAVQGATSVGLVLDSPNPGLLRKGLEVCDEKPILNAVSLEAYKIEEILPLAVEYDTRLVALLMDERSFAPPTADQKLSIALEIHERAVSAGLKPEALIFDPVLPNMSWNDAAFRTSEAVIAIRLLASGAFLQNTASTMIGLSNLRSGMRKQIPFQVEETCLGVLAGAGLEFVLADLFQTGFQEAYQAVSSMV